MHTSFITALRDQVKSKVTFPSMQKWFYVGILYNAIYQFCVMVGVAVVAAVDVGESPFVCI